MNKLQPPISVRPELQKYKEYIPGLSIEEIKRRYSLTKVIKLASNENPLGPSPKAVAAYKKAAEGIFRYPESRSIDLRRMISSGFSLDLEQVIIGAGSDEIIELLAKTFLTPKDDIVVSASAFMQYRLAADLMGTNVITVPMKGMKHDLKAMAAAATKTTKFVFIANPNNPTGTYNSTSEVEYFLSVLPSQVVPVFDEAYFEYAVVKKDYPSMIDEFFNKRPMVVLRTFSKVFGLAGLRVGYGIAPEALVRAMDKIRQPFNISVAAQVAAEAAFYDSDFVNKSVKMNEEQKDVLAGELTKMGFSVVPSAANFLLFNVQPLTGHVVFERMLRRGIITRSVDEYELPEYLRVTAGTPEENKKFLQALKEVFEQK